MFNYINRDLYSDLSTPTFLILLNAVSGFLCVNTLILAFVRWDWSNLASRLLGLMAPMHILTWLNWRKLCIRI